ncbi:hypothetical protein DRW07_00240 [Alteromonas sediminis]|uniref:YdbS-like PH domain-containing protein n=1 Tax=Alteromonas sediminis TaxID=2259342 RepID=A0A3N5Y241_9ALTE|nr:PH domain-containing protein [Alteromonas sediminis]RPJ67877.1 hypothetical protein DRW07_00240 [Alteromonas sediminis]
MISENVMEDKAMFTDTDTLPVSPEYRRLNISISIVVSAVLLLIFAGIAHQPLFALPESLLAFEWVAYGIIVFFSVWSVTYHWFADPKIRYVAREQDVVLHKGLIFRSITCQPVKRIQHVEIKQGPFERMRNLANLNIYSAGGVAHTFAIPGLSVESAEQLREFIMAHKDTNSDQ